METKIKAKQVKYSCVGAIGLVHRGNSLGLCNYLSWAALPLPWCNRVNPWRKLVRLINFLLRAAVTLHNAYSVYVGAIGLIYGGN